MSITKSSNETMEFGRRFAGKLNGGEVVLLVGDLGAGKTTLVKGAALAFGVKRNVTSPTFVLMKIYKIKKQKSRVKQLVHIDAYRGLGLADLKNIGALEYLGRQDSVCFVEWGERLEEYLLKEKIRFYKVKIRNIEENMRDILVA